MKRAIKITAISIASIIGILLIAITIVCNVVFSPKTLTPIVRDNVSRFITCQADLDTAELTFFSTFPNFTVNLSNVRVINPIADTQSDTLAVVGKLTASVNVRQLLFHRNLIINQVELNNTTANIFCDSLGNNNYNIVVLTSNEEDTTSTPLFDLLQVNDVVINNLSASYIDQKSGINASINGLNTTLSAQLQGANGNINAHIFLPCLRGGAQRAEGSNFQLSTLNSQLSINGSLKDNHFDGNLALTLPYTTFDLDGNRLADSLALHANVPAEVNLDIMHINLKNALIAINSHELNLNGVAQLDNDDINLDMQFATNQWNLEEVIALIPETYADILDGINISGIASLSGSARGTYNDNTTPLISANLNYTNGKVQYPALLPFPLNNINLTLAAKINLTENSQLSILNSQFSTPNSQFSILNSQFSIPNSQFSILNSQFDKALCDINIIGDLDLPELCSFLPDDLKANMNGHAIANISAHFNLEDAINLNLNKIVAEASIEYDNLDVLYNDSIAIKDTKGALNITLPSPHSNRHFKELAQLTLNSSNLQANLKTSESNSQFSTHNSQLTIGIGDILDTTQFYTAICKFDFDHLQGSMDTINFDITQPKGTIEVYPTRKNKKEPTFAVNYASESIKANMGKLLDINVKKLKIGAKTNYTASAPTDENSQLSTLNSQLTKLNPTINFDFHDGVVKADGFNSNINIPTIKFQFRPNNFDIEQSRIIIDESDFALSGNITNLKNFAKGNGLLRGNLKFESDKTNLDQLMDLVNGLGVDSEVTDNNTTTDENTNFALTDATQTTIIDSLSTQETNPFMVPKRVNFTLDTHIKKAIFSNTNIENLGGKLTIKDGEVIVEQMGFTTDAAEMQLTGIYRSERRNHLFAGFDFHLLNIDIAKLIKLIPAVDTIVPMLKSFAGRAQFHIAAETYLRADYSPKMSTLRAAAALEGKDLVLLDSKTFSTIAKYMMFNKKTENIIDSIDVEMTIFRNEVDIYPFLVSMDKWQAVLSGRHNLDNSFNYHISITDCPLAANLIPVQHGLDIKGTFENLKFNVVPCKYKTLYKPNKQKATEKQTLALKKIISDSLKDNVKQ